MTERDPFEDAVAGVVQPSGLGLPAANEPDPFVEAVESVVGDPGGRLNRAAAAFPDVGPDRWARAKKLAEPRGMAPEAVLPGLDQLAAEQSRMDLVKQAPRVAEFLSADPGRHALASEDYESLSYLDKVLHNIVGTADALRSVPTEFIRYPGMALAGMGELYQAGVRATGRVIDPLLPHDSPLLKEAPWWASPGSAAIESGAGIKAVADWMAVPEERQGWHTDIFGGVGQLGGMVVQSAVAPQSMVPSLLGLGAEQQAAKAREAGAYGTGAGDMAIATGAGATMLLERWGLDKLLNRLPPKIKNATAQWFADKFIAAGYEAGQEAVEGAAQNVIARDAYDPDQPILEGIGKEATVAGAAAFIVRSMLGATGRLPSEKPERGDKRPDSSLDLSSDRSQRLQREAAARAQLPHGNLHERAFAVDDSPFGEEGSPLDVRLTVNARNGAVIAHFGDGQFLDLTDQINAGMSPEEAIAIRFGGHSTGEAHDASKVRPVEGAAESRGDRRRDASLDTAARALTQLGQSKADAERLAAMQEGARRVKAGGDPALVEAFVREQADRTPGIPDNVYLDARAVQTFFQERGEDPEARVAEMMDSPGALTEALAGSGDLVVPIGTFTARWMHDAEVGDLLRDMARLAPDRVSNAELTTLDVESLVDLYASGERALPTDTSTHPAQDAEDQLVAQIQAHLDHTRRFDPNYYSGYSAKVLAAEYATRAARRGRGETAMDIFQQLPLSILSGTPADRAGRQAPFDLALDPYIDDVLAKGFEAREPTKGLSLVQAIIDSGGIDPDSVGAADVIAAGGLSRPGLINRGGSTLEGMAEGLTSDEGSPWVEFFTTRDEFGRPDYRELIDLLRDSLMGDGPTLRNEQESEFVGVRNEVAAAMRQLELRGTDLRAVGRPTLRRLIEEELSREGYQQGASGPLAGGSTNALQFANAEQALQSRLAQWFAALRVGGSGPRTVEARAQDIGPVNRGADNRGAAEQGDQDREAIREQSARLIERAQAEGYFWGADSPILSTLRGLPNAGGAEHQVYMVGEGDNRVIIRATDNGYFGPRADISPAQYLARLDDYSRTFPDLQTRLIGVSESPDVAGHAVIWTVQPFVRGSRMATQPLLVEAFEARGWEAVEGPHSYSFRHKESGAVITDAHNDNVYVDDNGDLYPFDVVVESLPRAETFNQSADQTQTQEFRRWFGDSKVVDADGKPLVVYHGAINGEGGFDVFDRKAGNYATHARSINAVGSWFTDSAGDSAVFSGATNPERFAEGGQTFPVYLSIKQPFRVRNGESLAAMWEVQAGGDERLQNGDPEKFRAALIEQGYDGLVMEAPEIDRFTEEGSQFWVAFHPEQIKSATGNRGTFDPSNPNILFQSIAPTGLERTKVVDAAGRPRRVYHAGSFDPTAGGQMRLPVFFADNREDAATYLDDVNERVHVTEAFLRIENPASEADVVAAAREVLAADPGAFPYTAEEMGVEVPAFELMDPATQSGAPAVIEALRAKGFDGARVPDLTMHGNRQIESWVVFGPDQILSADDPSTLFQSDRPFRSALLSAVEAAEGAPKKAGAEQWLGWFAGAQRRGAFRKDEFEWLGVEAWLKAQDGPITREAVQEYVRANELVLEEVVMGDPEQVNLDDLPFKVRHEAEHFGPADRRWSVVGPTGSIMNSYATADEAEIAAFDFSAGYLRSQGARVPTIPDHYMVARITQEDADAYGLRPEEVGRWGLFESVREGGEPTPGDFISGLETGEMTYAQAMNAAAAAVRDDGGLTGDDVVSTSAPFSNMTLPGERKGYRVMLVKMPLSQNPETLKAARDRAMADLRALDQDSPEWMAASDAVLRLDRQIREGGAGGDFTGGHFEPNTVAHIRFEERVDADGNRVLVVLETQSDWHQQGRKKGYAGVGLPPGYIAFQNEEGAWNVRRETEGPYDPPRARAKRIAEAGGLRFEAIGRNRYVYGADGMKLASPTGELMDDTYRNATPAEWQVMQEVIAEDNEPEATVLAIWQDSEAAAVASAIRAMDGPFRVPDAPFKTTWHELVMKRMVRYAAENGFDRVAWPTEAQVPVIEHWGMTLEQIREDPDRSKRFGAILDRYGKQIPRFMKAFGKPFGAQVVEVDVGVRDEPDTIQGFRDEAEAALAELFTQSHANEVMRQIDTFLEDSEHFHGGEPVEHVIELAIADYESGAAEFDADTQAPMTSKAEAEKIRVSTKLLRGALRDAQKAAKPLKMPALEITPELREAALAGLPLFQGGARGSITFLGDRINILLGEKANLSTLHHEFGHLFLHGLVEDAFLEGSDPKLAQDLDTFLEWASRTTGVEITARVKDGPEAVRAQIQRVHHESFAEGYETYLFEGKAPSLKLEPLFARFRAWMLAVYGALRARKVPITDEMRGVYDRLLATDAEIAEAEGAAGMDGLPAGLSSLVSPERWQRYVDQLQEGRDAARARAQAVALKAARQEAEAWWDEEKARIREEVEAEAFNDPAQRALSLLSRGVLPDGAEPDTKMLPLDAGLLRAEFGDEAVKRLPKRTYRNKGGMSPPQAASLLGFRNTGAMFEALANVVPLKQFIEQETDARMRARYQDPRTDGSLTEAAMEAVHGDRRLDALEGELALVSELAGQPAPPARALGAAARRMINGKALRDVRPNDYLVAERKASRDAQKALAAARPRLAEALMAKRRQVMNAYLYRAALEAKQVEDKESRYLKKFLSKKVRARLGRQGADYLETIDGLLAQISLQPASGPEVGRRMALLEFVRQAEARGETIAVPPAVLAVAQTTNIKDLSVDALRGIADTVRQVDHLARTKEQLRLAAEKRDAIAVDEEMAGAVRDTHADAPNRTGDKTWREGFGSQLAAIDVARLTAADAARDMDGKQEMGPVFRHTVQVVRDAVYGLVLPRLRKMEEDLAEVYAKHYTPAELRKFEQRIWRPEVGDSWSKARILALAMNWGNAGNRDRILSARRGGLTVEQVESLLGTLDARDWQFAQDYAAQINSFWPAIRDTWRRRTGLTPKKVEPSPFTVRTADGTTLDLPGWYYPISWDSDRSGLTVQQDEVENYFDNMKASRFIYPQTEHGYTEARTGGGGRTVDLNLRVGESHMRDVIRDLYLGDAVNYVHKVLNGKRFKAAVTDAGLKPQHAMLERWLRDVATGEVGAEKGIDKLAQWTRLNLSSAVLTFKVSTGILQITGLVQTQLALGKRATLQGLLALRSFPLTGPNSVWNYVNEASELMRQRDGRVADQVRLIADARAGAIGGAQAAWHRMAWFMIVRAQRVIDTVTWVAAERKGLKLFDGDVVRARQWADEIVVRTQAANDWIDKADIIRGNLGNRTRQSAVVKAMVPFMSFMLAKGARIRDKYQTTDWKSPTSILKTSVFMVEILVLEQMMMDLLRGGLPWEDEDDDPNDWGYGHTLDEWAAYMGGEMIGGFLGTIPVISTLATEGRGYTAQSPYERAADVVAKLPAAGGRALSDEDGDGYYDGFDRLVARYIVDAAGVGFGVPSSQINVTLDAFWRASEGDENLRPQDFLIKPDRKRDAQ